jgi:TraM recognition site of TraD and TraG
MSDYNCIDVIREARATVVAAAQSSTSFIPPLGREKARVFTLNLRNRIIFKAADEEGAIESTDFLGKKRVIKKSWGYSGGRMARNYFEQEEHKIMPPNCAGWQSTIASLSISSRGIAASCCRPSSRTEKLHRGSHATRF